MCLEIGVHLVVRQPRAWRAARLIDFAEFRRPHKHGGCPASYVRGHLPRNVKLLFDARDLGFESCPSWWIGYFLHKEMRPLRGSVEQQN